MSLFLLGILVLVLLWLHMISFGYLIAGLSAELRRHEAEGNIRFLDHHRFISPILNNG